MSARWNGQDLLQPITPDAPCGENLEDTVVLATIESSRLFGRSTPFDQPPDPKDKAAWKPPEWDEFNGLALDGLKRSRDLRLLANLGVGLLRTDGIAAFLPALPVASHWLETYWDEAYPRLDEGDALVRRNALNCFADSMAVLDGLRRLPLVTSRQHGSFSLRDIDIATGQLPPRDGEARPDAAQINAAFGAMPIEELTALSEGVSSALAAARKIDVTMGTRAGPDAVPQLDPLVTALGKIERVLQAQMAARTGGSEGDAAQAAGNGQNVAPGAIGAIRSRQDAIRALDAVAQYFRDHEPSSPIPLFVNRAKRLVSKDFLEVLADVVPDALSQAKSVGGVREDE